MNARRTAVAAVSAGLLLLTGCAAEPSVDLDDARAWIETVEAAESDGPGGAGTASMQIPGPTGDEPAVTAFTFDAPTVIKRVDARCFGGGTAELTVSLTPAEGAEYPSAEATIPCDQEPHGIPFDAEPASGASVQATGSAETYLHVTLIQELVVER
ncbi:hypothetical protein ACQ143_12875 [Microbacterium sp. MC2]